MLLFLVEIPTYLLVEGFLLVFGLTFLLFVIGLFQLVTLSLTVASTATAPPVKGPSCCMSSNLYN